MTHWQSVTHKRSRQRRSTGLGLVEVLFALVVLGLAVLAVTQAVTAGHMQTHEALHRARAMMLAEAMVEEVLSKPYDQMSDYHDLEHSPGEIADHADELYPDAYQLFTRSVEVEQESIDVPPFGQRDGLLVTVTVFDDRNGHWSVRRFVPDPDPDP